MSGKPEIWKPIPENPAYSVSDQGRVIGPKGIVNPTIGERGYLRFSAMVEGKKRTLHVHQLVCRLFHGEAPEGKPFALHNNHNKTDCRKENLRWGSHLENMEDRRLAGRIHRRLTREEVEEIRRRHADGESQGSLGRAFGVTQQYIGKLVKGKTWKDLGNDVASSVNS